MTQKPKSTVIFKRPLVVSMMRHEQMSALSEMIAMFVPFVGSFLILHLKPGKQLASCDLYDGVNSYNIRLEDLGLK